MINLSNTTLVCIGSTKIKETLKAINICHKYCNFYNTVFFTDKTTPYTFHIKEMKSIKDYDYFVVKELPKHVYSDYVLTVHWDGFIVNPDSWTNDFFNYDYIGAPWPWMNNICGNGGFCFKSRKFLFAQQTIFKNIPNITEPDDLTLCMYYKKDFVNIGCQYAPPDIAYQFSTEHGGYDNYKSFGFHDFKYNPQFKYLLED